MAKTPTSDEKRIRVVSLNRDKKSKREEPGDIPTSPAVSRLPEPPVAVKTSDHALQCYQETGKLLVEARILSKLDINTLIQYSIWYGKWMKYELELCHQDHVIKGAQGGLYPNPNVYLARQAGKAVEKLGQLLGLDPRSRMALKIPEPPKGNNSPLDD